MVLLYGPHPVHPAARRVCIPKPLADEFGLRTGCHVRVVVSSRSAGELAIQSALPPSAGLGRRDPNRPRLVTAGGQLTLPASLLEQVGITPEEPLVYFAADEGDAPHVVRIVPARRISLRELSDG